MIGVFDSGFGGLTVIKEVLEKLPTYSYIYLGDNARAPYGNRSQHVIYEYTKEAVKFLVSKGCTLIIIACNTASSEALRLIQQEYLPQMYPMIKVLGVIRPTIEIAIAQSLTKRIGIVGTRATIASNTYERELKHIDSSIIVCQQPCPLLVPFIEEGWDQRPEAHSVLKKYILSLKSKHIDTLILGCTHYPVMEKVFAQKMGKRVKIISSAKATAEKLVDYLNRHSEVEIALEKNGNIRFYTTDDVEKFETLGSRFLGKKIKKEQIELVSLL